MIGKTLGPYRILDKLGEGGMGEVYRATDTRLNRTVAVKVLPPALAGDEEFRARFDREAQVIASLTHPHICTLHDVGHQDGIDYLVLEYLDGETLEARLERGALPVEQTLACAIQIADALDAAHRGGIVHRDLKPGNVFLVRSGSPSAAPIAKLLDFGLARPAAPAIQSVSASQAPTTLGTLTAQGTILGTFQYMAPEQLEGREADARTDIFAFGDVVYEMVTGKKAFEGRSQASLIGAIMHGEPPSVSSLQPLAPGGFDRLVKKCLAKDLDERWQTARDLASELRWIADSSRTDLESTNAPAAGRSRSRREALAWTLSILGFAAAGAAVWMRSSPAPASDPPAVLATVLPPDAVSVFGAHPGNRLSISPDGRRLAYVGLASAGRRIYVRRLDGESSEPLAGSENGLSPFWSPDSRSVAFFAAGKLKKVTIDASGSRPLTVCDLPGVSAGDTRSFLFGGTWSRADVIVFSEHLTEHGKEVFKVAPNATPVHFMRNGILYPFFLPDGTHFLYRDTEAEPAGIYVGRIDQEERRLLVRGEIVSQPMFAWGYLFYVRDQTLLARRLDPDRLEVSSDEFRIASPVLTGSGGYSAFSVSASGIIAYQAAGGEAAPARLEWFDRAGRPVGFVGEEKAYTTVALSSDGRRLIAGIVEAGNIRDDLWLFDLSRDERQRFTLTPEHETTAVWSPDDTQVVYGQEGRHELFVRPSDLRSDATTVFEGSEPIQPMSWSRDLLLYQQRHGLSLLPMQGDRKPIPLAVSSMTQKAQLSPDGQWLAYMSLEEGQSAVYVVPIANRAGRRTKVVNQGGWPRWSRDGSELFFWSEDRLMAADMRRLSGGEVGVARVISERIPRKRSAYGYQYDVSPDGRFLVVVSTDTAVAPPISVLTNWSTLIKAQIRAER